MRPACPVRPGLWAGALLLLVTPPLKAHTLPFDPLPTAFQQWLNSRQDWPKGSQPRFNGLARCTDKTATASPYGQPVYTCLAGTVTLSQPGGDLRRCELQRVSYYPRSAKVRYWTSNCR